MKKLLLIPVVFLLSGCAPLMYKLYDSYMLAPYDNVEYSLVNKVRTQAAVTEAVCSTKTTVETNLEEMYFVSRELKNFSQHIPDNKDSIKLTKDLYELVNNTRNHYLNNKEVSAVYCKAKFKQIYSNAETIQKAIGARPR